MKKLIIVSIILMALLSMIGLATANQEKTIIIDATSPVKIGEDFEVTWFGLCGNYITLNAEVKNGNVWNIDNTFEEINDYSAWFYLTPFAYGRTYRMESQGIYSNEITAEEEPIVPQQFGGYTFGTSDCNRIAILLGQEQTPERDYKLGILAWDYKYETVDEVVSYCERNGADMTPITSDYYDWSEELKN